MYRILPISIACGLALITTVAHATDLLQVYHEAAANNATYQSAQATYEAAKENIPIARGNLLPNISATGSLTKNYQSPGVPKSYTQSELTLTLTQNLFNLGVWENYGQSYIKVKQAAITFAIAEQSLIQSVTTAYFNVLQAQDQLRYAKQNEASLAQQMKQTTEQYKVGLKAFTDVQSTRASYEQAVSDRVAAANTVHNNLEALAAITGRPESNLATLEKNFPLIKPTPLNPTPWVNYALKHNLQLISDNIQTLIDQKQIKVDEGGNPNTTVAGYWPTAELTGTADYTHDGSADPQTTRTASIQGQISWTAFNGFETYHTVNQDKYTVQADIDTAEQTRRDTISSIRQDYLNILSDISQIQALNQAVISGESSLKATKAAYEVGTRTIVDLLTEQSTLFQSQQNYADAIYQYIDDSIQLKLDAGLLSEHDIVAINNMLVPQSPSKQSA